MGIFIIQSVNRYFSLAKTSQSADCLAKSNVAGGTATTGAPWRRGRWGRQRVQTVSEKEKWGTERRWGDARPLTFRMDDRISMTASGCSTSIASGSKLTEEDERTEAAGDGTTAVVSRGPKRVRGRWARRRVRRPVFRVEAATQTEEGGAKTEEEGGHDESWVLGVMLEALKLATANKLSE